MNDIMKDIVNRGTAAQVQSWGFRNVPGKTAFAGKTGTSRDGWFAGFTPELVVVVYVGFDDNDDLGMKGSDSAMPIWADFMKAALDLHPEWNGDWAMPAGIRKAEIDIRNGALIRELDGSEVLTASATPTPAATISPTSDPILDDPAWAVEDTPERPEIFVTDVPAEFRRVELFIGGTIPNRLLLNEQDVTAAIPPTEKEPTEVDQTWQEGAESNKTVERDPKSPTPAALSGGYPSLYADGRAFGLRRRSDTMPELTRTAKNPASSARFIDRIPTTINLGKLAFVISSCPRTLWRTKRWQRYYPILIYWFPGIPAKDDRRSP